LEVGELEAMQLICYLLLAIGYWLLAIQAGVIPVLPAGVTAIDYQVAANEKAACI